MVAPGQMRNVILRPLMSSGTETTSASDCWSKHPRIGLCIQPLDILRPEIPFDPGGCPRAPKMLMSMQDESRLRRRLERCSPAFWQMLITSHLGRAPAFCDLVGFTRYNART